MPSQKITLLFYFLFLYTSIWSHPSWGIVVDSDNNIYFADIGNNGRGSVWKLYSCGEIELLLGDFHAHNVSLDANGNLITAHGEDNHTIVKRFKDGALDTLFQTRDHVQFFGGNCTYTLQNEILFCIEHYIWRLKPDGNKEKISHHYFEWNQAIFSDKEGNVYAPDKAIHDGALIKIDKDGQAKIIATNLLSTLARPRDKHNDVLLGMGKDENGAVYICENAGRRVIQINEESGQTNTFYTSDDNWFPTGVYFHNQETYILEFRYTSSGMEGPQIVKLDKTMHKQVLFNHARDI